MILDILTGASKVVPQQILATRPSALDPYNKALIEGEICDKRVPIMLIGQDRSLSGKTSLKNLLRGKPFNAGHNSTAGITVDPSHFKVSTEMWKVGETNQETNSKTYISYEHHAARLTVENLKQIENSSKKSDPELMQNFSLNVVPTEYNDEYNDSASLAVEHLRYQPTQRGGLRADRSSALFFNINPHKPHIF